MASLTVKQYDTYPPFEAILTDNDVAIPSLNSALSITFVMKGTSSSTVVTGTMTVLDNTTALVEYQWETDDLSVVDEYEGEVLIEWSSGSYQTVPNDPDNNFTVNVVARVDGMTG